ncbi:MAG TPA: hypothetical protein ENK52_03780 [Saprospiraceae bacterium]|nr:hypothetical protein [Saprospiraceae bacterium]
MNAQLKVILALLFMAFFSTACSSPTPQKNEEESAAIKASHNKEACKKLLQKHLDAVSNKDLETLKSTLTPTGDFYFVMPQSEITSKVEDFVKVHEQWFQDTTWTFDTKILMMDVGDKVAYAVVEIVYREPERNGKPYFNRMAVSYGLRKIDGNWYVSKDHACSLEKTKAGE